MLQDHINNISLSRLSTYLDHFYLGDPNKLPEAVALYTAIQHRSGIFFSLIQEIEVAMRNAIADCLRQHSENHDLGAYFQFLANDAQSPLSNKGKKQLRTSMANTKNENDIIANITFGFWVNLLNTQDPAMKKAFSQLFSKAFPNFTDMYFQLKQVHTFRNDLYHQDKAWNRKKVKKPEHILADYHKTYQQFERLLSKIAPHRLQLRSNAALNKHYLQLNFDISLFNSEVTWLKQNI
nr:MAG TPA: Abi-like protein [Caudoviricetes sp.]DAX33791.1 MAG TPA: Abi-like protein [Caudoviricetes sp.]